MPDAKSKLDEVLARLKQERDELALKIHLGRKEAAAEWEKLEAKWKEISAKRGPIKDVAAESARNVGAAVELAAEEIKKGYAKIRKML